MCAMQQNDENGSMISRQSTGFMTNAPHIASALDKPCSGDHRHVVLIGEKTKRTEVQPDELCKHILHGLQNQMRNDGRLDYYSIGCMCAVDVGLPEYEGEFWDDISGKLLNKEGVIRARQDEMKEFREHQVYVKVPIKECMMCPAKHQ